MKTNLGLLVGALAFTGCAHAPPPATTDLTRSQSTAASVSSVGISPAHAITTSGSAVAVLAHCQMPTPRVQCAIADSMSR